MTEANMSNQRLHSLQFRLMAFGFLLAGLAAGLAIDVARDFMYPDRAQPLRLEKRELALRGNLELERAVQDLKDCILRGDFAYSEDFVRHMEEVDRTAALYRARGALDQEEEGALRKLHETLPRYQAAIYAVRRMRAGDAPISEIDMAVKGKDRPIAAAFAELETAASDPNAPEGSLFRETALVLLTASFAAVLLYFSFASTAHGRARSVGHGQSLQELSNRIVRWEEEREAKAFSVLHDGVCQSLSAVMYLLKSVEHPRTDRASEAPRSNLAPVVPSLQGAIRDTLAIALDLRPPRLQESGLLGTLDSLWAECRKRHPALRIEPRISLDEEDVPGELKPVILRIARMAMDWAVQQPGTSRLAWVLATDQAQIRLSVRFERGTDGRMLETSTGHIPPPPGLADAIHARILLAGGVSEGIRDIAGGQEMLAVWPAA
jgi:signal transduction histidine kinase